MDEMKTYTHEEMLDRVIGKKGTPRRARHDEAVQNFLMGEAIKQARLSKHLTQSELGKMIGVKGAQVSRIESGENLTIATVSRVLKAMDIHASFDIEGVATVSLW